MSRLEYWLFHAANAAVVGTGVVYAWMRYALAPVDDYAVVNHPLQPLTQHLHILAAPLLVAALGHVWARHAWAHWRAGTSEGRQSGIGLAGLAIPMVASGYLLQITVSPLWRGVWTGIHLGVSVLWIAGYAIHVIAHVAARQRDP